MKWQVKAGVVEMVLEIDIDKYLSKYLGDTPISQEDRLLFEEDIQKQLNNFMNGLANALSAFLILGPFFPVLVDMLMAKMMEVIVEARRYSAIISHGMSGKELVALSLAERQKVRNKYRQGN